MPRRPRPPKYQPLADYLAAQPGDTVTLTFAQVEAIVGAPLPRTAGEWSWWANRATEHVQARAWLGAGWRRGAMRPRAGIVTFVRQPPGAPAERAAPPIGC